MHDDTGSGPLKLFAINLCLAPALLVVLAAGALVLTGGLEVRPGAVTTAPLGGRLVQALGIVSLAGTVVAAVPALCNASLLLVLSLLGVRGGLWLALAPLSGAASTVLPLVALRVLRSDGRLLALPQDTRIYLVAGVVGAAIAFAAALAGARRGQGSRPHWQFAATSAI